VFFCACEKEAKKEDFLEKHFLWWRFLEKEREEWIKFLMF